VNFQNIKYEIKVWIEIGKNQFQWEIEKKTQKEKKV
jgi:hypothetical protein